MGVDRLAAAGGCATWQVGRVDATEQLGVIVLNALVVHCAFVDTQELQQCISEAAAVPRR